MRGLIRWFRALPSNPIYLREKGQIGKPNPFFETMRRYSPFVVIGAIVLGSCAGFNPFLLDNSGQWVGVGILMCLPGIFLSMLTLTAIFMVPTLTAPIVGIELRQGTWEILRLTPQPTGQILLAKLFGALARLKTLWWLIFALSAFQGVVYAVSSLVIESEIIGYGLLLAMISLFRPWAEILFTAFFSVYLATWVRSPTIALVGSYASILLMRLFNNSFLWGGVLGAFSNEFWLSTASLVAPGLVYAMSVPLLGWGIMRRADRIQMSV